MTLRIHPSDLVAASSSPLLAIAPWWTRVRLGDVAKVVNGAPFKSDLFTKGAFGRPLIRIRDIASQTTAVRYQGDFDKRYVVNPGDLLIGMDGDFKIARWQGVQALLNQRVCRLDIIDDDFYDHRFVYLCIQPYLDAVHAHTSSVTVKHLSSKTIENLPIPLPPREEQERIVGAIEDHLFRLARAEQLLKVAKLRLHSLRAKLKEAVLPYAPLASLGELKIDSRYGTSVRCSYDASGPGVLRIPNIVEEQIDPTDLKYSAVSSELLTTVRVQGGDVLFVRTNGSRDLIGRAAVASGASVGLGFASYLIRYRFSANVDPTYVCAAVSAPSVRRTLEQMAATTAGQYNLSISKLDSLNIPLPALGLQRRLVAERAAGIDAIAGLTAALDAARLRGRRLHRSILAAAFSGQLVPQDPADEPASVLLQRIRAERDAQPRTGRARKVSA